MIEAPKKEPATFLWTGTALGEARCLPPRYYTSEEIFKVEMEYVHRRNWFFVGRAEELAKPGDYRAIDTVGGPVLLVRDQDSVLRAFANFCRHRGAVLHEGCGNRKSLLCPYHAWAFRLDGRLLAAPGMEGVPGFEQADNDLVPVRMAVWEGNIFLNFDDKAPDLMTHLGDYPDWVGSHRPGDMVCTYRYELEALCNWKLVLENAMETYHTGIVHARTVGAQKSLTIPARGQWRSIQVLSERSVATLDKDAEPPFPPIEGLSDQARKGTFFSLIDPVSHIAFAQDCMWWLTIRPVAVDRTMVAIGGAFPRAYTEQPDFEEKAKPYYERWEKVAREDLGILEKQQKGFTSALYRPGLFSWRDDVVHDMNQWLMAQLPQEYRI